MHERSWRDQAVLAKFGWANEVIGQRLLSTNPDVYSADTRLVAAGGTQGPPVRFTLMTLIDAEESRAQAKHCRELAMSTKDAEIELLFLQTAEDLERQADRLETFT